MAENTEIQRVLVTGASGYIAAHIVQQLQEEGCAVRGTVRSLANEARIKHLKGLCPDAAHELELVEADLENEESWKSAVDGCMYVIHTASPFPLSVPADENVVIKPAVEGVTNVLKAVVANGKVKRVVLTSAGLAICGNLANQEYSEKDWPADVDQLAPYPKSKTLAEKAAWDFVQNLKEDEKFELVVVHPVGVVGPILSSNESTSTEILKRLLKRNPPMVPKVNLPLVDVRDVAAGHIAAMKCPEAAGNRHILCGGNMWWTEIASVLREEFCPQGYNVPTRLAPKFCIRMAGWFNKDAKMILSVWNKESKFDNTRMKEVLKIEPRDLKTAIIEMGYSLIEAGIVKKKPKYHGPGGAEAAAASPAEGEGDTPAATSNGPTTDGEAKAEAKAEETKTQDTAEDNTESSKVEDKEAAAEKGASDSPGENPFEEAAAPAAETEKEEKSEAAEGAPAATDNQPAESASAENKSDEKTEETTAAEAPEESAGDTAQ
ncbi:uncharacterized protein [Diadema antillarum]|uniref:uncharacterized protein n=1 Tax=Diadema antillarum TaxID=105358 RepID=UPI003A83E5B1